MAYTTIDDPSAHFHTRLYSGNGQDVSAGGNAITNNANAGNFQPDWVWIKTRGASRNHNTYDSSRGVKKALEVNDTPAESTVAEGLQSFDTNGFTVGSDSNVNQSTTIVAWQWKANGGTTSSNSDGDITSTVQANTTAGFSIVTYTGNGNGSDQTVGHGLGAECKVVFAKMRTDSGDSWRVFHESVSQSGGGNLFLNGTSLLDTGDPARIKSTNTSTFTLLAYTSPYNALNASSKNYVAYCFAEKQGYSKFGSYKGNGSSDGTFIYTGFKPAWFLAKRTNDSSHWTMLDTTRNPFNLAENYLHANETNAENNNNQKADFLSNGIKLRSSSRHNNSGSTFIYMAFAEHPFVSSKGVPVTAR